MTEQQGEAVQDEAVQDEGRFWMVHVEGGASPRRKHPTQEAAMAEAERLAKQEGKPVFVLEATMGCVPVPVTVTWRNIQGPGDAAWVEGSAALQRRAAAASWFQLHNRSAQIRDRLLQRGG